MQRIEPPRRLLAPGDPRRYVAREKRPAIARIERSAVWVEALRGAGELGPAAETGIGESARRQPVERGGVIRRMFALPARRRFEAQAEPGEVADDRRLVLRLATAAVQVFNAQQQPSVR